MATPREDMERVARILWGEPNRAQSRKDELRFGANGSKSVDLRKLEWFDHEAQEGGGLARLRKLAGEPIVPDTGPDSIAAIYPYRDEGGAPLFQVVRKIPKKFVQRHADPSAPDGWAWHIRGIRRVLYRLPELLAADPKLPVFIPEGEKDVDNLRALGLVATCNPGGAAEHKDKAKPYRGKWRAEYNEHLRGRDVVILPDNDQAGRDHAADVTKKLAGIAHSIRILELPDLAEKGDPSDWIADGGTAEALLALVQETKLQSGETTSREPIAAVVAEFNAKFFVVNEDGKAVIYAPRRDPILNRRFFDRLGFGDFEKLYANRSLKVGEDADGQPIYRNAAKLWITHRDRRQFLGGVTFDPSGRNAPDVFNLWQGFAVEPRVGCCSRLLDHMLTVICDCNTEHYDTLLDLMADMVQHPERQGEVAIVLRGKEGCGKGTLAKALLRIFGQHGMAVSNSLHFTGNFNGHLRDCVFLFVDEALYAGDKQHVGVLKSQITEPYLTIEAKYQNPVLVPNRLHVMMASNEDWVVPAGLESRRWFVLDVSDARIGDTVYFAAIYSELENGGYEALLHFLLHRDLSERDLRKIPVTEALQEQRKRSMDTVTRWWLDCLHRGYVFESRLGLEAHWQRWHEFLPTEVLFTSYGRYCEQHRERHPLTRELFGGWMRKSAGCKPERRRDQPVGEHLIDREETDSFGNTRHHRSTELIEEPLPRGYSIGPLGRARQDFERFTGLSIEWEDAP